MAGTDASSTGANDANSAPNAFGGFKKGFLLKTLQGTNEAFVADAFEYDTKTGQFIENPYFELRKASGGHRVGGTLACLSE